MDIDPIEYLRASNGLGEAVRANVVVDREIGSMEINVDTLLNWPPKFIATSGALDLATGTFDPETVTVFYGHSEGNYIKIDKFAPGYEDIGNQANDMVVLKPTTPWADAVVEAVEEGGASVTISDTPPADAEPGDLWGDTSGEAANDLAKLVGNVLMPIGFSYINYTDPTDPAIKL